MTANHPTWDEHLIGFRHLRAGDLVTLHTWLNTDHVRRWWGEDEDLSLAGVIAEYTPLLDGQTTVTAFIIEYAGEPVGYVQRYDPHDHPGYWGAQQLPAGLIGIDLLIGAPHFAGVGFGPVMIRAFLRGIFHAEPAVTGCMIDPDPENFYAIRAYEKVGFQYARTIGPPEHREPAYLMFLRRDAILD